MNMLILERLHYNFVSVLVMSLAYLVSNCSSNHIPQQGRTLMVNAIGGRLKAFAPFCQFIYQKLKNMKEISKSVH